MPTPQDELEQAIEREPSSEELKSAVLLLVDDNLQNVELMQAWLESLECKLETAHDGVEAIEAVARCKPDLILLDVMMPRMSGFEVCRKIKQDSALRDTVIIMVTALNEVGDFERAVECGCDDFLVGDLRFDPVTISVLVGPSELMGDDDSTLNADWTTLHAFAAEAAPSLLRIERFRARRH